MDRAAAYRLLADELLTWRLRPYVELAAVVNSKPQARDVRLNDETVQIEVSVSWEDSKQQAIEIRAAVLGSSCWQLERCEERIVVSPPAHQLLRNQRSTEEEDKWDLSANINLYCAYWRQFFQHVGGWDARHIEECIESMRDVSSLFHEEPATWAVWAVLPHRPGAMASRVEEARNKLIRVVLKHNPDGNSEDWQIVRQAYLQLQSELDQPNQN
jgi:hypothetical protein